MIIKTKEFSFPRIEYLKILVFNTLRRNTWAVIFLILVGGYGIFRGVAGWTNILLIAMPFAFFSYLVLRCWLHMNSKKNKWFFRERFFEIDDKSLTCRFPDGGSQKILMSDILRVVKKSGYYQLFLSKKSFIYIPWNAFKTSGDMDKFDFYLKSRKRDRK
jgi:hypothetical protein